MTGTPTYCVEHGDTPTSLRCTRCERPVCPRCMVQAPVGIRCREHGQGRKPPTYQVSSGILARGITAGLAIGVVGGLLLAFFALPLLRQIPYGAILCMVGFGYLVGEGISRATNRKRGGPLVVAAVAGVALAFGIVVYIDARFGVSMDLFDLLGLAAAIYFATSRVR